MAEVQTLTWFVDRIGKIVFRNKVSCPCAVCQSVYESGLLIQDRNHAEYVCDVADDFNRDGSKLIYFDTKEDRDLFELK